MAFQVNVEINAKVERCEIVWQAKPFRSTKNYKRAYNKGLQS